MIYLYYMYRQRLLPHAITSYEYLNILQGAWHAVQYQKKFYDARIASYRCTDEKQK